MFIYSGKVVAIVDARLLYCLCTVQLKVLLFMVIGMASAGMVSRLTIVLGVKEYVPAPMCWQYC